MIILSWNCQGLRNQRVVKVLSHLVREKAPKMLFLMETKRRVEEMRSIQAKLPYDAMLAVPCLRRKRGLAMLWKEAEVDLKIQTYTQDRIEALILTNPMKPWRITGFYGRLEEHLRHETWGLLRHLQTRHSYP